MMDGSFVKEFAGTLQKPQVMALEGVEHLVTPPGWAAAERKRPAVGVLKLGTLTGLVDYVKANVDGLTLAECLLHIESPGAVVLRGKLADEAAQYRRHVYVVAAMDELVKGPPIPFGEYLDAERFFVGLQAGFMDNAGRQDVLRLIASIRENFVKDTVDSGVSQEVRVAGGVTLIGTAPVPNPVVLKPYRTFREIDQPSSTFVLRARAADKGDKPLLALFEADGGAWKLEAIQGIAQYLRTALPTLTILA